MVEGRIPSLPKNLWNKENSVLTVLKVFLLKIYHNIDGPYSLHTVEFTKKVHLEIW